jgi:hypothetical protein
VSITLRPLGENFRLQEEAQRPFRGAVDICEAVYSKRRNKTSGTTGGWVYSFSGSHAGLLLKSAIKEDFRSSGNHAARIAESISSRISDLEKPHSRSRRRYSSARRVWNIFGSSVFTVTTIPALK